MSSNSNTHDLLRRIGFNSLVARAYAPFIDTTNTLARVVEAKRSRYIIHAGDESHEASALPGASSLPGAGVPREADLAKPLVVGDWVLAAPDAFGSWWVSQRLAPFTEIHRIEPSGARQSLVANVETAFIVMGLDRDFSPRRLERYLALVKSAGVAPVVVLTKADLCADVEARLDELASRLPSSVERYAVNATDAAAAECLTAYLGPGETVVLLGSSGAGKSTLTNTLMGSRTQSTGAVRESDSRGRHTTTSRSLRQLPGGACLIDTPGLRGLRLDLANYQKLRREVARDRADPLARQASKAEFKARQRALRAMQKQRGR
jgi:ribosome biogenesis GTPase / thiamine phosphate phosphatase